MIAIKNTDKSLLLPLVHALLSDTTAYFQKESKYDKDTLIR